MSVLSTLPIRIELKQNQTPILTPITTITLITAIAIGILCLITLGAPFYYKPSLLDELYYIFFHRKQLRIIETTKNLRSMMNFHKLPPFLKQLGWATPNSAFLSLVTRAKLKTNEQRLMSIINVFSQAMYQKRPIKPPLTQTQPCPPIKLETLNQYGFTYCKATCQGLPSYMEDTLFDGRFTITINQTQDSVTGFVLMDGHAAPVQRESIQERIDQYVQRLFFKTLPTYLGAYLKQGYHLPGVHEAFKQTFKNLNHNYRNPHSGSTFIGVFFINQLLFCVSIGDSKAFLVESQRCTPLNLSAEPNHPYFAQKLEKQGLRITQGRVEGLNMATALGDKKIEGLKPSMSFIAVPRAWIQSGSYLVLGSDGVFDYISTSQLTSILQKRETLAQKTQTLIETAFKGGSDDNLSALIVPI
jgi:serine/threonine protein phosphatase PrpC